MLFQLLIGFHNGFRLDRSKFFVYTCLCCANKVNCIVQSLFSQQNFFFTKMVHVATTVPSGINTIIGALVIDLDLRSRPDQSHLPGALLPRW